MYGRRNNLRLPFDAATADIVHRRLLLDRRVRTVWTPISTALLLAAIATFYVPGDDDLLGMLRIAFLVASFGVSFWTDHFGKKVAIAQQPELIGRLGIYLPAVAATVAREWITRNPTVLAVPQRPRWRRYPSRLYRWAAGVCAVAGVSIWWVAPRRRHIQPYRSTGLPPTRRRRSRLGFKALPVGFIRWEDPA